jgi:hypothetical protein
MSFRDHRKSNYRNRRNKFRKNKDSRREKDNKNYPICPICKNKIKEIWSAINYPDTEEPAHFDCILKSIENREELASHEKICYLGNGSFGIVRFQKDPSVFPFIIRKRIQYEDPSAFPVWRTKLFKN